MAVMAAMEWAMAVMAWADMAVVMADMVLEAMADMDPSMVVVVMACGGRPTPAGGAVLAHMEGMADGAVMAWALGDEALA
mmetsp:Transcript_36778/g.59452  ORF Transcript_36778/g.59452 Transcript_36778/m.59452 type:complete len:80 (-) Transcript_36778:568-807(-)